MSDTTRWTSAMIEALVAEILRTQGGHTVRAELRIIHGLAEALIRSYVDDPLISDLQYDAHEQRLEGLQREAADRGRR